MQSLTLCVCVCVICECIHVSLTSELSTLLIFIITSSHMLNFQQSLTKGVIINGMSLPDFRIYFAFTCLDFSARQSPALRFKLTDCLFLGWILTTGPEYQSEGCWIFTFGLCLCCCSSVFSFFVGSVYGHSTFLFVPHVELPVLPTPTYSFNAFYFPHLVSFPYFTSATVSPLRLVSRCGLSPFI